MKKINNLNLALFFILFSSIFAISFAYISEYVFGYKPCILCLVERKFFFFVIFVSFIAVLIKNTKYQKILLLACLISLTLNVSTAFYHVGVEQKFFKGLNSCSSGDISKINSIEDLEKSMADIKITRCDKPDFFFLGMSMALWNLIYSTGIIFITATLFRKKYNTEK